MRGYIIIDVNIVDAEGFMEYAKRIPELIEKHGGRYIVKGAVPHVIRSGGDIPQYSVVLEFPSVDEAKAFIEEGSKSSLIELFNRATTGRILSVEGCI